MRYSLSLLAALATIITFPHLSVAQQACTPDELESIVVCQANAAAECISDENSCSDEDVDLSSASNNVAGFLVDTCCQKPDKGRRVACFRDTLKKLKEGRALFSRPMRSQLNAAVKEAFDEVRTKGECVAEEPAEDGEDALSNPK